MAEGTRRHWNQMTNGTYDMYRRKSCSGSRFVAMRGPCSSGSLYATPVSHLWFTRVTCLFSVTREIFIRCRLPLTFFYIPATSIFNTVDVDIRYDWRKWYFVPSYDTTTFAKRSGASPGGEAWNTLVERRFHARIYWSVCTGHTRASRYAAEILTNMK